MKPVPETEEARVARLDRLAHSCQWSPEQQTAEAAAKRKYCAPEGREPGSSYMADLNGDRVTQDMLRHPSGPHWSELVKVGSIIKTNYNSGPYIVEHISEREVYGVLTIGFTLSYPDAKRKKDGTMWGDPDGWISEIVAVDGELLKLFLKNKDTVTVEGEHHPVNVQVRLM